MVDPSGACRFLRRHVIWLACAASVAAQSARPPPNWINAAARTTAALAEPGQDIIHLVRKLQGQWDSTADEMLFKLSVFVRAGMESEAIDALRELKKLQPKLPFWEDLLDSACANSQFALAHATLELHGDAGDWGNINRPPDLDRLVVEPLLADGWSVGRVDSWLSTLPRGQDDFILLARLEFNLAKGDADGLLGQLVGSVRSNPRDLKDAVVLLRALGERPTSPNIRKKWPMTWMVDSVQPRLATESARLGVLFSQLGEPSAALHFFRRGTELAFTQEDAATFFPAQQVPGPTFEDYRRTFLGAVFKKMAGCHTALHETVEAEKFEKLAVDLASQRFLEWQSRPSSITPNVHEAVPHSRAELEAQESSLGNDPDYWLKRAEYFGELNDGLKVEEALKRGLAVAMPAATNRGVGKGSYDPRSSLLTSYANFLERKNRADEGIALLWREFREAPADAVSRRAALGFLLWGYRQQVSAGDELVWQWLNDQVVWDSLEEKMLGQMLRSAATTALPGNIKRAVALAHAKHPTRAYILGQVLIEMGQPDAGVPLLEEVLARSEDRGLARTARRRLLEYAVKVADWKKAEALFTPVDKDDWFGDGAFWYGRIALAAARAGAKQDAVRLWQVVVRRNPQNVSDLPAFSQLGLKTELAAIYRALHRTLPTSRIPARALKLLGAEPISQTPTS